jgi:uncharacterized oxidoreductase
MKRLAAGRLQTLITRACEKMGAMAEVADQVATSLVRANLCGYDSHGVHRLVQYYEWWKAGLLDPTGRPSVTEETAFAAKVDGGQTFGPVAGAFATRVAIAKAQESGIGIVTVRRSTQVGRLADYAEAIQQAGLIGLVTANDCGGGQCVVPWGGMEARLATNPIAMGIPGANGPGILFDFATSAAAFGKVRQLLFRGEPTPSGWLLESSGKPSTDPSCLFTEPRGALLPFGGHKGYAVSLAVEVLSGILSGAGFSSPGPAPEHLNGMFILALNVAWFVPLDQFRQHVDQLTSYVKSAKPAPGGSPVVVPGEPDREEAIRREREGIPFSEQAWGKVATVLRELDLDSDSF